MHTFCPFLGEVLSKSLETVEYQLSGMTKDVGRKFTQLKQLDTRLGSCEHLITEVPTLRYTIEEEVRSAQIREAAFSERLEYIEKLTTSLSDRLCKSDESGTEMGQRKFFNDVEDLQRVTVQQAAQLEALRKELSLERAHSREGVADLQHRITECNNQLVSFQRFVDTCDSFNLKSSPCSKGWLEWIFSCPRTGSSCCSVRLSFVVGITRFMVLFKNTAIVLMVWKSGWSDASASLRGQERVLL